MERATLVELLRQLEGVNKNEGNDEVLRYAIYARKSTEDAERQARSLSDQITECKELAIKLNLKIVDTIAESESAKEPDIRPKFNELIKRISKNEIDGIIAWHPDRLARNMKDAGTIIDLLDKGTIKDCKFVSYTFENSTAGKMHLGITFAMSKQYSDQLSENVRRGNKRSVMEGKYLGRPKNGYIKDENQYLRPDADNFFLIQEAFKMRVAGENLEEIATYLNKKKYSKPSKNGHEEFTFNLKRVSYLLKDEIYTGILNYGGEIVDLTTLYDFKPMVSIEDFLKINKFSALSKKIRLRDRHSSRQSIKASFLRGMVICGHCNHKLTASITNKHGTNGITSYYYFKCESPHCSFFNKGVRGHIILDFAEKFLEEHRFTSKPIYEHFVKESKRLFSLNSKELERQKKHFEAKIRADNQAIEETKKLIRTESDTTILNFFKNDLKVKIKELETAEKELKKVRTEKEKSKDAILTYSKFLELFGNLPLRMRETKNIGDLDFIIRKLFSNFTVKHKKVASFTLNQPFKDFEDKGYSFMVDAVGLEPTTLSV